MQTSDFLGGAIFGAAVAFSVMALLWVTWPAAVPIHSGSSDAALCQFDGPAVPGHAVQASTTVAGACHDTGSTGARGGRVIGTVSQRVRIPLPPGSTAVEVELRSGGGGGGGSVTAKENTDGLVGQGGGGPGIPAEIFFSTWYNHGRPPAR